MCHATPEAEARRGRLRELLIRHLQAADVAVWPGADGLTVGDVVDDYPRAAAAGRVPTRQQLLDRHPDLTAELSAFFDAENPCEPPATAGTSGG